jgi:hypothetical protein
MLKASYFLNREKMLPSEQLQAFEKFVSLVNSIFDANRKRHQEPNPSMEAAEPMDIVAQSAEDEKLVAEKYVEALKDLVFDTYSMKEEDSEKYRHHYASNIAAPGSVSSSKMARLMKVHTLLRVKRT